MNEPTKASGRVTRRMVALFVACALVPVGVTLAIVRKARDVFWAAVGMALLLHRGLSPRTVARDAEAALAEQITAPSLNTMRPKESS